VRTLARELVEGFAGDREGPVKPMPDDERRRRWEGLAGAWAYHGALVDDRRARPRDDTTANLMAHMVMAFDERPDALAAVRADPALWDNAVEEGLRRRGSAPGHFRIATRDVEVAGTEIPRGSLLWLVYISAGHDEGHFPDPRRFDPRRENAKQHLAFGRGRHMCTGAPLARLVARIGLETLYDRLPGLRVVPGAGAFLPAEPDRRHAHRPRGGVASGVAVSSIGGGAPAPHRFCGRGSSRLQRPGS
jgi:Cytochrome P450